MSKLWELQLTNTLYLQISPFDYRSENLRHLSEHSSNFGDARRITTENSVTVFYIYLFGNKIVETVDTAAARQTVVTCVRLFLSKV